MITDHASLEPDDIRARLDAACAEGLAPNITRWHAFAGTREGGCSPRGEA